MNDDGGLIWLLIDEQRVTSDYPWVMIDGCKLMIDDL